MNIVGRIKDMIIRGGENVYPREIEEFLYTHPAISDVQVDRRARRALRRGGHGLGDPARAAPSLDRGRAARASARARSPTTRSRATWQFVDGVPDDRHRQGAEVQDARAAVEELGLRGGSTRLALGTLGGMPAYYDEAYEAGGEPRPHYRAVLEALGAATLSQLGRASCAPRSRERGSATARPAPASSWSTPCRGSSRARSGTRSTAASPSACGRSTPSCATPMASGGSSTPASSRCGWSRTASSTSPTCRGSRCRCGPASPGSTSSAAPTASSTCSRTTCGCRPGSASRRWPGRPSAT